MDTKIITIDNIEKESYKLREAANILKNNGIVAFPTETVYGLGGNAFSEEAIRKIFLAKGRPSDNPLIVHISDVKKLKKLVKNVPPVAEVLIQKFWPGPLTLIFEKLDSIPYSVTGGLDTVAIRMPSHEIARELISLSGLPIAAPSANLSGKPSPTNGDHVIKDLNGRVDAIVCGGDSDVGLESTVLDISGEIPVILRPGGITMEEISAVIGQVEIDPHIISDANVIPKAPGMKYTHYSPNAELVIFTGEEKEVVNRINLISERLMKSNKKVGIMTCNENLDLYNGNEVLSLGSKLDYCEIARNLFFTLRKFDDLYVDVILSEAFELSGIGSAIMNRLKKASGNNIIEL